MTASADDGGNFKPLFNGKNLDGWKHVGPGEFVVENGALKSVGGMGLLFYPGEKFGNAVIRVVYKVSGDSNSGVFIRIPEQPTEPWMPVNKGYEVQIDDSDDDWHRTGVLYSFTKTLAQPKTGEWNTMEITLEDERTVVTVNGTKVTDFKEGSPVPEKKQKHEPDRGKRAASGYIGLQNHNDKDVVYFKEVSVKKLK
ncbi:3-keto-disaccharide hydrolase [Steroidobacter agaridevorans]